VEDAPASAQELERHPLLEAFTAFVAARPSASALPLAAAAAAEGALSPEGSSDADTHERLLAARRAVNQALLDLLDVAAASRAERTRTLASLLRSTRS
jgi:hypothetical protein